MSEELREAIARALAESKGTLWNSLSEKIGACDYYREMADALLSGPLAPLLAAQAAVERVRGVCEALSESSAEAEADSCRAVIDARKVLAAFGEALDGTP